MDRVLLLCVIMLLVRCYNMAISVDATIPNIATDQSALLALKHHRVIALNLSYMGLEGTIPPQIGNLSFLVSLRLKNNSFHGSVPNELSRLYRLKNLNFGFNNFNGEIPSSLGLLSKLRGLFLIGNRFTGAIPQSLSNLSSLERIGLAFNELSGYIPPSLFNISTLQAIDLGDNKLLGPMPSILFNMPSLQSIDLSSNELSGRLPKDTFNHLPNLQWLELSHNIFYGGLPSTLFSCKHLQYLSVQTNHFTGRVLPAIGNLTMLEKLYLIENDFAEIFLDGSNIKGSIFQDIDNLSSLIILDLSYNELAGLIPTAWEKLGMLQVLYLHKNRLQGPIPSNLCHLKSLFQLSLGGNELVGQIPRCINNLALLRYLYLGANKLTSTIPLTLWSMKDLLEVDLSSNSLSGPLSLELGNMKVLRELNLSNNRLSGDIPMTIGSLKDLYLLSLAQNLFEGSIPESFGDLVSLELLDVSNNNLSGEIPKSLEALIYLKYLNVSFNRLQGEIPTRGPFRNFSAASFMSNDRLCGAPQLQVLPCKKDASRSKRSKIRHILTFSLPAVGLTLILVASLVLISKKCQKKSTGSVDLSPLATWRRVSHHELLRATEGFNPSKLIGEGSFGSVYKATFLDGKDFAIKVLNLQIEGAFHSFDVECEVLSNIRHRNLVKIISACSNIDFKAIVLEYMPNGNLETWLYSGDRSLSMLQRLNIMIDVATALEYLHFGYSKTIVHCDLKPNNILLDEEMVAHVADFGIAKLLGDEDLIKQTMTLATIGYMAPEYGSQGIVSTRGDVYSYGILLMETFTRKKPTDNMFVEEMNLKRWVEECLADLSIVEIIDDSLLGDERYNDAATMDIISSIMGLALDCCVDSPEERINTRSIPIALNKIKSKFLQYFQRT
ncbi:hypothetical protein I3843_09G130500 [Carya illinoinensis]|nr:hypothetical protein I3843_09G130500 [Carya illinoinensis]